ncbi:MAG: peptidoglycan-binding protein [Saprospiraceae bacterium]|nr:peptidoglycan-binding protein [Saprospiraceae bacterium]
MSTTTLRLGKTDQGSIPADLSKYFGAYHASMAAALKAKRAFREEANGVWKPFEEIPGTEVKALQQFLKDAGFMPNSKLNGIYDYSTQAAVRLFQEYIRTVEGDASIGTPDGVAGSTTFRFIEKWKAEKQGKPEFVCEWGRSSSQAGSADFNYWLNILQEAKAFYSTQHNPILALSEKHTRPGDTKKIKDWDVSPDTVHLIGIRRKQEANIRRRENDDLFVLLIKGMVFKFWGSTDPNQNIIKRRDEPFLIEGQHSYKFGWHKVSDAQEVYRAFEPATVGVLVFRDRNNNDSLDESDIARGLDAVPNETINIHWSGKGGANFSAGCQVIAGQSYSNHKGKVIDCTAFASLNYDGLAQGKTRGAYNMLTDLILSYLPEGVFTIAYTLARDETFLRTTDINEEMIAAWGDQIRRNTGEV